MRFAIGMGILLFIMEFFTGFAASLHKHFVMTALSFPVHNFRSDIHKCSMSMYILNVYVHTHCLCVHVYSSCFSSSH